MASTESTREYLEKHQIEAKVQAAINDAVKTQTDDPCGVMAASLNGPDRLVIYASNTPDRANFTSVIKCQKIEYDYDTQTAEGLIELIECAVANFGLFRSIAFACKAGKDAAAAQGYKWALTASLIVGDESALADKEHQEVQQVRSVMQALGRAVVPEGRVDLLSCELLATPAGKSFFELIQQETATHFAASDDITSNVRQGGDWIMESDGVDIKPLYFHDGVEVYDGHFGHSKRVRAAGRAHGERVKAAGREIRERGEDLAFGKDRYKTVWDPSQGKYVVR